MTRSSPALCVLLALPAMGGPGSAVRRYDQPAVSWEKQPLPIGNGSLGAMLFGGVDDDVVQFTVDSLWTGMSLNPYGGGGWNWNIEGTAWLAQHVATREVKLAKGQPMVLHPRSNP